MIMRISMPNRFRLKKVMGFRTMIRPERGEIHYIGGADILPAPLSLKEETEALNKFGTEEEIRSSTPTLVLSNFFAM